MTAKASEDRRRHERRLRHQIDDLRYAFKKLDPPLDISASYEAILPRIQGLPEFQDIQEADADARRVAWDKYVKRQLEKKRKDPPLQPHDGAGDVKVRIVPALGFVRGCD